MTPEEILKNHFELLLDKYELNDLYSKFNNYYRLTIILKEGFYWTLIYFSEIVKEKPEMVNKLGMVLLLLLGINIPLERKAQELKSLFYKEVKIANTKYYNDKINNMNKNELLNLDLVEYFNILEHLNDNLESYIYNLKIKQEIPIRMVTLIIIAMNKKYSLIIGLFAVYYYIIKLLNEHKIVKEVDLTKKHFEYESIIRNYIVNGKTFLINDEFNKEYLINNYNKFEDINKDINELNHTLDRNTNITMLIFIIIIIMIRIKGLNHYDFFTYFLIVYDIDHIGDKLNEYYKTKSFYNKMIERINYLNNFKTESKIKYNNITIDSININKIENEKPLLKTSKPIVIKNKEHILVQGESGSGKTSLLYLLKGIMKPKVLEIEPSIELINSNTYLTLPNHKSLFNGKLYDIITNYSKTPDIKLINYAIFAAKISNRLNENDFVNIETLSGGEKIRLLIARIIYTIKTRNYNILLFDEIDENLNDELAIEICNNLRTTFNDKIILYITHNEQVKKLFDKKIIVEKGIIL